MEDDSKGDKNFVQPEKEDFERLFSRRVRDGPLGFQTQAEYEEEMRGIEAALRELGGNL